VGYGDGGVLLEQHQADRLADDLAAAEHHRPLALQGDPVGLEHANAGRGGAGAQTGQAAQQPTLVHRVQPVHVLARRDPLERPLGIQSGRQRQLHQDAVHRRVRVQPSDQRLQLGLAGAGGDPVLPRGDPGADAGGDLAAHIDVAGRVVADQDHGQAGRPEAPGRPLFHRALDLDQHPVGMRFPVKD